MQFVFKENELCPLYLLVLMKSLKAGKILHISIESEAENKIEFLKEQKLIGLGAL